MKFAFGDRALIKNHVYLPGTGPPANGGGSWVVNIPALTRVTIVAIEPDAGYRFRIRLDDGMECLCPDHYLDCVPPLEQLASAAE